MTTMSKTAIGIAAGVAGTLFLGYCLYFDRQRRSDPNFKKKLKERRRANEASRKSAGSKDFPNLKDADAIREFFLQEVQLGELKLASGDMVEGVEHLSNAVRVCRQPTQLLQVLQQTLPPEVFDLLLQRLPGQGEMVMHNLEVEDIE